MTNSISTPSDEDAARCLPLRKASKLGAQMSGDEMKFCERIWSEYPKWYSDTASYVFNATLPFGAEHLRKDTT